MYIFMLDFTTNSLRIGSSVMDLHTIVNGITGLIMETEPSLLCRQISLEKQALIEKMYQ